MPGPKQAGSQPMFQLHQPPVSLFGEGGELGRGRNCGEEPDVRGWNLAVAPTARSYTSGGLSSSK